jgi:penicillin-binding protein 2
VHRNASLEAVARVEERRPEFPNVFVDMRPKRRYVLGEAFSHVIGYISEITAEELDSPFFAEEGYRQGMLVGKGGIERQYEHLLQGEPGVRYVEVDARGRIVGDFGGSVARASVAGQDLHLSLDLELQEFIHEIFPKHRTGAVVALDPATGGVLALYSWPTFNSNDFVGGISRTRWEALQADSAKPLFDRSVMGTFPPASTFKPVIAAIGLDLGVINGNERMPYPCVGGISLEGHYARCWRAGGHGSLDLVGAIANSCNVYFYQLGQKIGLDRLLQRGLDLGLAEPCDIDLPQERAGTFPESRDFWLRRFGAVGTPAEVLFLSIGQGPNEQTPLKVAQYYMALARDGSAPAPTLYSGRTDDPHGWELDLSPEFLELEREGLRRVVRAGGTAYLSQLELWDLLGKTGSGENALSRRGLAETDAWFAGIAGPFGGEPEIVIVAMVEHGGGGSTTAAPLAAKAVDFYLRRKHGIPVEPLQTLREHMNAGIWPAWAR